MKDSECHHPSLTLSIHDIYPFSVAPAQCNYSSASLYDTCTSAMALWRKDISAQLKIEDH
jgi:hypothetical protein